MTFDVYVNRQVDPADFFSDLLLFPGHHAVVTIHTENAMTRPRMLQVFNFSLQFLHQK